ncbi:MAG: hypothetical protein ACLFU9_06520 [Candidatus Bathyarchaeia archaeon]
MKKTSPFSPSKNRDDNQVSMTYGSLPERLKTQEFAGDSLWLSKKMVDEGCTLEQTLQVMKEKCKTCDVVSPMICVEQCETWKVKKELHETCKVISEDNHRLRLLNALKNRRRLAIIDVFLEGSFSVDDLQKKLKKQGFYHSRKTIDDYLKPLVKVGLVQERDKRFKLTLYGRKICAAVVKHGFVGKLPSHSGGYEEKVLRRLLDGAETRSALLEEVPEKSLSRTLKRLRERSLIVNNFPSDRVFYFRSKRALSLERLSPTQKKICQAIPEEGISAHDLSRAVGINLRRVYKYLRNLRGKKLVFRRNVPIKYKLTAKGNSAAEFLEEIAAIT